MKDEINFQPAGLEVSTPNSRAEKESDNSVTDSVRMYLRQIGRYPLLKNREEEVKLYTRINRGRELQQQLHANASADIMDMPRPHLIEDLAEATRAIKKGEKAEEDFAVANLRLVVNIAKKYKGHGLDFLDLIQEGNIGLLTAIEKFDISKGFKFSTYGTWWIRQAITRAIGDKSRMIRIPVHMHERLRAFTGEQRALEQRLGRPPTVDELILSTDLSRDEVAALMKIQSEPLSLDAPVGEEEKSTLVDFVNTDDEGDVYAEVFSSMELEEVEALIQKHYGNKPRTIKILRLRFGLDDGITRTLDEVGKEIGVTRERIRQIESKALRRLRFENKKKQLQQRQEAGEVISPEEKEELYRLGKMLNPEKKPQTAVTPKKSKSVKPSKPKPVPSPTEILTHPDILQ